ncbi:hypothetical protein AAW12_18620 [Sphingobacterium sp. Ag1]|uniref:hypothetical protein n=1 Tax=Sphingobacterium sp. Ag1 TaxID=1643451 RepID=UPI000627E782|nr:hypothetical protein [Sphingobacterium sp. Ag1]KKO89640.1 hypothetical protein AAW12_18620 [Sphingobacterium sp. Ag1]
MRKFSPYIVLFSLFSACTKEISAPQWPLNNYDLVLPANDISFDWSPNENYRAILYSFSQPIELSTAIENGKLNVSLHQVTGVTEGPAELLLLGKNVYHFPLSIKNKGHNQPNAKTFYSPRTFNPDSSLIQQRLSILIDKDRNLHPISSTEFFGEQSYTVSAKAGIYCPEQNNPLSCYYVNPGTCSSIPININRVSDSLLQVEAGPLVDQFNNLIANGTLAQFILTEEEKTTISEVLVQKGYAKIKLTIGNKGSKKLRVKIGDRSSKAAEIKSTL